MQKNRPHVSGLFTHHQHCESNICCPCWLFTSNRLPTSTKPAPSQTESKMAMPCLVIAEVTWTNMVAWPLTCGWHLDSTQTHTEALHGGCTFTSDSQTTKWNIEIRNIDVATQVIISSMFNKVVMHRKSYFYFFMYDILAGSDTSVLCECLGSGQSK